MNYESLKTVARQLVEQYAVNELKNGYRPTGLHVYDNVKGKCLYIRIRLKHPNGKKWIRPFYLDQATQQWVLGEPIFEMGQKPLYHLSALSQQSDTDIWITEGEQKVELLEKYGFVATTSGGSTSTSTTDWEPLRNKPVVLWPDNDDSGTTWLNSITTTLQNLGCIIRCVEIARLNLLEGGDVMDWVEAHPEVTKNDFLALPILVPTAVKQLPQNETECRGGKFFTVECIRASDINPEPIEWLWDGWLAAGKIHIFGGAPGTGKTTIAMKLASIISRGTRWPDGSLSTVGNVMIWSGEDDAHDTLIPRLIQMGANRSNIYFIENIFEEGQKRAFDPACDMFALQQKFEETGDVRLLIIDPIVSAVTGDSHKNAEVRRDLQPLVNLAASSRCAVLGITHFSKGTAGRDPIERVTGSLAFVALARIVLVAAKKEEPNSDGKETRIFLRAKSNIGSDKGGFEYELIQTELKDYPGVYTGGITWGKRLDGSARDLLTQAEMIGSENRKLLLEEAQQFLQAQLSNGPVARKVINDAVKESGFSDSTMRRAKKALGIESKKIGNKWVWQLKAINQAEDAQQKNVNILSTFPDSEPIQEEDAQHAQGTH